MNFRLAAMLANPLIKFGLFSIRLSTFSFNGSFSILCSRAKISTLLTYVNRIPVFQTDAKLSNKHLENQCL